MKKSIEAIRAEYPNVVYPNREDYDSNFWEHNYLILMSAIGTQAFIVNADNEQDAMDYVIDYCQEHNWYIMTEEDIETEEYLDEYVHGGNNGIYLNVPWHEVRLDVLC